MTYLAEVRLALDRTLHDHEERGYLGMSQIGQCPFKLFRDMQQGRAAPGGVGARLCHEGYLHERDVIARLNEAGMAVLEQQRELVAPWDARFRGHIDGTLSGVLLEVKSVNTERFMRVRDGVIPDYHIDQVQCYLHFGGFRSALIVYKNREDGDIWTVAMPWDEGRGIWLERKAAHILAAVDGLEEAPRCTCGRCSGGRR